MTESRLIKTLFVSLRRPAEAKVSGDSWDVDNETIVRGLPVLAEENPWVSMADLLINADTREFVGVTFIADPQTGIGPSAVDGVLNPDVIRYDDLSSEAAKLRYPGQSGHMHRCEIIWCPCAHLASEWAQLMFCQWAWLCPVGDGRQCMRPPVAFVITDIDELLHQHALSFPRIALPVLDVNF